MLFNYKAKVTNVVDGDTVDAIISLGFYLTATLRLRLLGVNTPEMHGPTKEAGKIAKDFVKTMLLDKEVLIHTEKGDSFGRWLAIIYIGDVCFNDLLIKEGYAISYLSSGSN